MGNTQKYCQKCQIGLFKPHQTSINLKSNRDTHAKSRFFSIMGVPSLRNLA
jgi:hypothetical protein